MQPSGAPTEGYQALTENFQLEQPLLFYQINGRPAFSYGDIQVQPGKKVLVDGEAMLWMDSSLELETECYGGCKASCMRACSGESCCMNTYSGAGKLTVGFDVPGDMLAFGVSAGNGWLLTHSAFVAGTENLKVSGKFAGCGACCCGEEGPFITVVTLDEEKGGNAAVFLAGGYGMLERHDVPQGKTFYTVAGTFFATHESVGLSIGQVGGCKNFCCGAGWKSIVLKFQGPCTVYTQSRNPLDLHRLQVAGFKADQAKEEKKDGNNAGS